MAPIQQDNQVHALWQQWFLSTKARAVAGPSDIAQAGILPLPYRGVASGSSTSLS